MKEFITIKNFGPLRNIENLEIKQFTFLIGESASGKSTLMKVICMMRYIYKMANIRSYLRHSKITKSPFRMVLPSMMKETGLGKMLKPNSSIIFRVEIREGTAYELRIENKTLRQLPIIAKEDLVFNKVSFISENRNIIPNWTENASHNAEARIGFYFKETNTDFARASEYDKVVDLNYLGMKLEIVHPKGKPTRYLIIPNDDRHDPIELRDASSGIQTSVPLTVIVKNFAESESNYGFSFKEAFRRSIIECLYQMDRLTKFEPTKEQSELPKNVFVHIEEPELSLFPDAQCQLIEELIYTATHADADRTVNLMLATHSPYILNYMNIVLNQTKEGRARLAPENLAVYRLYEGKVQNLVAKDDKGRNIVDSFDLSEMMSTIYNEFIHLGV